MFSLDSILDTLCPSSYHASNMTVLLFVKDLVLATLGQMASLFAGFFVFGLLIQFLSQLTFRSLLNAYGSGGTYVVSWLGTPIHELGHALFCLIFGHRIEDMKLFKPDPNTGTLGYVYHTWNPKNPWHVLGNFFIGIGPIVMGCAVLFALFYFLIPDGPAVWDTIIGGAAVLEGGASIGSYFSVFGDSTLAIIRLIFDIANLSTWRFWVFLYLSICIASNIRLSWADFKHSLAGLGCIVLPFFLINLICLLTGYASDRFFPYTASIVGVVYSLLILALILAVVGFIIIYIISALYYRLRYKTMLNPFS
jgi:hypothetical protein